MFAAVGRDEWRRGWDSERRAVLRNLLKRFGLNDLRRFLPFRAIVSILSNARVETRIEHAEQHSTHDRRGSILFRNAARDEFPATRPTSMQ